MEYPNYATSDLMGKWSARLPLGDIYERCVSLEWLQEKQFIPLQLTTADQDDDEANATNGKVIRLTSPNTVLVLEKTSSD
jgi:hypothetical protein